MKLINSSIVFIFDGEATLATFIKDTLNNKILPSDISSKQVIHVPAIPIIIDLENGYSIHIYHNKLNIQINYPEPHQLDDITVLNDKLEDIATNFIDIKKELNYKALGINFKILIPTGQYWLSLKELQNQAIIVDLKYHIKREPFIIINQISQSKIEKNESNKLEFLFDSNFHLELSELKDREQIIKDAIAQRNQCFITLKELIHASLTPNEKN